MTSEELLDGVDHAVRRELGDESLFTVDQQRAIRKAIITTIIGLLNAGAIRVPPYTPAEERRFREIERAVAAEEKKP
jgi:hypothetical protein